MGQIGAGVEYGLHCLLHLVGRIEGPAPSARDLAEFQGVSSSYVAKLFTKLEKAGLVRAAEGVGGGFRLARTADRITVLEVVDAIEERKPLFKCREVRRNCVLYRDRSPPAVLSRGVCGIHAVMLEAEEEMRQALGRHSLADIAAGVAAKVPARHRQEARDWFAGRTAARARGRRARADGGEA